jgi:hypothetical protein
MSALVKLRTVRGRGDNNTGGGEVFQGVVDGKILAEGVGGGGGGGVTDRVGNRLTFEGLVCSSLPYGLKRRSNMAGRRVEAKRIEVMVHVVFVLRPSP